MFIDIFFISNLDNEIIQSLFPYISLVRFHINDGTNESIIIIPPQQEMPLDFATQYNLIGFAIDFNSPLILNSEISTMNQVIDNFLEDLNFEDLIKDEAIYEITKEEFYLIPQKKDFRLTYINGHPANNESKEFHNIVEEIFKYAPEEAEIILAPSIYISNLKVYTGGYNEYDLNTKKFTHHKDNETGDITISDINNSFYFYKFINENGKIQYGFNIVL